MQVATILPEAYLDLTEDDTYHMCLANLIHYDKMPTGFAVDTYTAFYRHVGYAKDKYLIMDNGVVEGDQRPLQELIDKARFLGADEIILPDTMYNMNATLDKSYGALMQIKQDNLDHLKQLKVMAVPQGQSLNEWLYCAQTMIDWDIDCLGIPKILTKLFGRDARLNALRALGNKTRGLDVHLLGCWSSPLEILMIEKAVRQGEIRPVRGVDSAIAFVYAQEGLMIDDAERPQGKIDFSSTAVDASLLVHNIARWREAGVIPEMLTAEQILDSEG
jgi:hypothetical protein